jgi:mono/diheme cytochrome c family protein
MRHFSKAAWVACAAVSSAAVGLGATTAGTGAAAKLSKADYGASADGAAPTHWKVLDRYCVKCHNTEDWAGGVAFDALAPGDIPEDAQTWEKAIRKLRTGMMPPAGKPRPARAVLDGFATELASRLDRAADRHPSPGSKSLHRLNRTEYANAIRDLRAFDVDVTTLLPADDAAEGFDNMADVLSVSPTLVQSYVSAAMKVSRWSVGDRSMAPTLAKYAAPAGLSQQEHIEGLPLGTHGGILVTHNFPLDAEYEFRVAAGTGFRFAGPAGGPRPSIDVTLNGEQVKVADARKFRMRVKAGPQAIGVALVDQRHSAGVDDLYSRSQPPRDDFENVTVFGPLEATGPGDTPSRRAIFVCYPKDARQEEPCAREILTRLATRAFRRPMQQSDPALDSLLHFYEEGRRSRDFEAGIQQGVARLLADPQFLYRIEMERTDVADGAIYRIGDFELASRLSFFLWSSIPDEALLEVAREGHLSEPRILEQQVRRMLADSRSSALVENFAGQWLRLRELRGVQPSDPDFDENLRVAFQQETQMLFANIMHEDRSVSEFLDADYTFVNERLARQYGIPNIHGTYMRRVALPKDSPRRGLLGQGSILTVTSAGNRTSPVQRGAWVMETLFGAPVPQPPPGVDQDLKEDPTLARPMTVRQRLELHRAKPTCAACHQIMDPIGFSLENFDLDGRWREVDGTTPIDTSGTLVDGTPLNGVHDLRTALLARSDSFVTSTTEKLLMYALGRRIETYDEPAIRKILREARRDDYRFSALVLGIVRSVPFQMKGKPAAPRPNARDSQRQARLNSPLAEKGKE